MKEPEPRRKQEILTNRTVKRGLLIGTALAIAAFAFLNRSQHEELLKIVCSADHGPQDTADEILSPHIDMQTDLSKIPVGQAGLSFISVDKTHYRIQIPTSAWPRTTYHINPNSFPQNEGLKVELLRSSGEEDSNAKVLDSVVIHASACPK